MLRTPFEYDGNSSWTDHPRPSLMREGWQSLCGTWKLEAVNGTPLGKVRVPFPPESRLSGIERDEGIPQRYRYTLRFVLSERAEGKRVLLHFGAVDQVASVSVNGQYEGVHEGGYLPFTFDVTPHVRPGENSIRLDVTDTMDTDYPMGKQRRPAAGIWYTPFSGIWQPVWLEFVPEHYMTSVKISADLSSVTLRVMGGEEEKILTYRDANGVHEERFYGPEGRFAVEDPHFWTPEDPYLYECTVRSGEDMVTTYFALRTFDIRTVNGQAMLCLNGKPYFCHGVLDQGYYSDGLSLPASPEGFRSDIRRMKALGFNMLRKHIKIEPDVYYFECDRQGMLVFQDIVNSGRFSPWKDSYLPIAGLKKRRDPRHVSRQRQVQFEEDLTDTVRLLENHPSVVLYTLFNEGWGQFDTERLLEAAVAAEPDRVWDAASGWFYRKCNPVTSEHIYFRKIRMKPEPDKPMLLSEFGGFACPIGGHMYNAYNERMNWGYKICRSQEELAAALEDLYMEQVLPAVEKGLSAAVYTQLSDVENEINGLLTFDRQMTKVNEVRMRRIADRLRAAFARRNGLTSE